MGNTKRFLVLRTCLEGLLAKAGELGSGSTGLDVFHDQFIQRTHRSFYRRKVEVWVALVLPLTKTQVVPCSLTRGKLEDTGTCGFVDPFFANGWLYS